MHRIYRTTALGHCTHFADCPGVHLRIVRYAPKTVLPMHAHESASITLVIRGGFEEESPFGTIRTGVGDCVIKPPGAKHANIFGNDETVTLQIQIPAEGSTLGDSAPFELSCYRCGPDRRLARILFGMLKTAREPSSKSNHRLLEESALDAISTASNPSRKVVYTRPAWMTRVEREIRLTLPGVLRVADLADLVGIHPVHMARVFQRIHGCGVVEFVHRLRVQFAAHELTRRRSAISSAALAAGFCDQPHLNRAFRRQLGISPASYRRLADAQGEKRSHTSPSRA